MLSDGGCGGRGLITITSIRGNDRGPIFHAKPSSGKIVAQVRYASRLPRVMARQDYLTGILLRIGAPGREKCDPNHSIFMKILVHIMTIDCHPERRGCFANAKQSRSRRIPTPSPGTVRNLRIPAHPPQHGIMRGFVLPTYAQSLPSHSRFMLADRQCPFPAADNHHPADAAG